VEVRHSVITIAFPAVWCDSSTGGGQLVLRLTTAEIRFHGRVGKDRRYFSISPHYDRSAVWGLMLKIGFLSLLPLVTAIVSEGMVENGLAFG